MKLVTYCHHVTLLESFSSSGDSTYLTEKITSESQPDQLTLMAEAYISTVWHRSSPVSLKRLSSCLTNPAQLPALTSHLRCRFVSCLHKNSRNILIDLRPFYAHTSTSTSSISVLSYVCWNSVIRRLFGYNRWESVKAVLMGLGRLNIKHLIMLRKTKFYRHFIFGI